MAEIAAPAFGQTRELLDAPSAESRVRVEWDAKTHKVVYAIDDEPTFRGLPAKSLLLVNASAMLTTPRPNPLRRQLSVGFDEDELVDQDVTTIVRSLLATALVAIPGHADTVTSIAFVSADGSGPCAAIGTAMSDLERLAQSLYGDRSSPTIGRALVAWRDAIDAAYAAGRNGPDAIGAAVTGIDSFLRDVDANVTTAAALIERIDMEVARPMTADSCAASARAIYDSARVSNPRAGLRNLTAVASLVRQLRQALAAEYLTAGDARWTGIDFQLAPLPVSDQARTVEVRVVSLDVVVDDSSGALIRTAETTTRTTFSVRRLSKFVREFAAGTIFGTVTRPSYGTGTNAAGLTTVVRTSHDKVSVNVGFLAGLVCRCGWGPFVAPMFQAGVSTSREVPALLIGGGVRLFGLGSGDISLGAGWMLAWVKDLKGLKEGDVVSGTADIESHLKYVTRTGAYWALQYKF